MCGDQSAYLSQHLPSTVGFSRLLDARCALFRAVFGGFDRDVRDLSEPLDIRNACSRGKEDLLRVFFFLLESVLVVHLRTGSSEKLLLFFRRSLDLRVRFAW